MAFYIAINGHFTQHEFDYFSKPSGRRLEATVIPGQVTSKNIPNKNLDTWAIEIMSKTPQSLGQENTIEDALALFKKLNIHHLPIIDDGRLNGMISDRDIIWLKRFGLDKFTYLKEFMSKTVLCCDEETTIDQLAKVIVKENISALPVLGKESHLMGIVTHHDILRWVYEESD